MVKFYYKVLNLSENCSHEDIKRQYKKLSLEWHPDRNPENPERASEMFNIISEAYQIIGNENRRKEYDSNIKYRPNKLINSDELFNYIYKLSNPIKKKSDINTIFDSFMSDMFQPLHINPVNNKHSSISNKYSSSTKSGNKSNNIRSTFHTTSSITRNGKTETETTKGYVKNGKSHIQKQKIFTDKDGKRKKLTKNYYVPINNYKRLK